MIAPLLANCSNCRKNALGVTMKRSEFTESQIVKILCEARMTPVNDVAKKHNVTEGTIYAWHRKFGQMGAEGVRRLRRLKNAHARRQRDAARGLPVSETVSAAATRGTGNG
jgi:putative transposase